MFLSDLDLFITAPSAFLLIDYMFDFLSLVSDIDIINKCKDKIIFLNILKYRYVKYIILPD